ncbi:gas vesicle protein, partial [Rhodococcus sp. T2V]|nr:gas vesicle protein [Rhodococcus sp. T2V]
LVSDVKGSGSTKSKTKGVLEGVSETLGELLGGSSGEREPAPRRRNT